MTDEKKLLSGALRFDEASLAEIYDRYSPELYVYAVRQLGEADLAEECVSETYSKFLDIIKRGRGPRNYLRAYLYRIAHNWISDSYRRQPPPHIQLDQNLPDNPQTRPAEIIENALQNEQVRAALSHLTPNQRQVIVLKFIEGWKHKEISDALGKPIGAVKALQHRGMATLRKILLVEENLSI